MASASMLVKVIGMIVGLVVSVFLGRTIGAEGLGIINLANRIVSLLLVFALLGMNNVLVKQIAIGFERKDWQLVGNSIYTSSIINGLLGFLLTVTGILLVNRLTSTVFQNPALKIPLIIAFGMIVPQVFSRIFASGLIGFRKVWQSNLVNETLSIWGVGIGLSILLLFNIEITINRVALLYAFGRLLTTTSISLYWKKIFRHRGRRSWIAKPMVTMALPLLLASVTSVIATSADTIMLGWLSNAREVGLYSVAARLALLVSLFLHVTNSAISPKLASLYADEKIDEMKQMVKRITGALILIALLSLSIFILGGNYILGLWGIEFKEAYIVLVILGIGQFFNISTGSAGLLLIMCGHERTHGYIALAFVILNLILNYIFISRYAAVGAAFATAITIAGENITKVIFARIKVGILTVPF